MANLIDILDAAIFLLPVAIAAGWALKSVVWFAYQNAAR